MARGKATCPVFTAAPELRGMGAENQHENVPRGKRGPAINEPAAGSPRAVRARRQEQQQGRAAPWAIARRCSFVERRKVGNWREQQQPCAPTLQDTSWDETAIEPGSVFRSVGSGIEPSEAAMLHEHAGHGNCPRGGDGMGGHGYAHGGSEVDEHMGATQDSRYQDQTRLMSRGGPIATPARNQRSAGVQTNRHSIMRHHRENGGCPDVSDDEQSTLQVPGRRALQDATSMMNSKRGTDSTSMFSEGRLALKEMSYPSHGHGLEFPAASRNALQPVKAAAFNSTCEAHTALTQVVKVAIEDEFQRINAVWGTTAKGGSRAEDRVAYALRKIAGRVEKAHTAKMMPFSGEQASASDPEARCAQLEREHAEADRRIAELTQVLEQPSQPRDVHSTLANLSDRLSAMTIAPEVPRMAEFEEKVDEAISGIVVANTCARHLYQQLQEEKKALQEGNLHYVPAAASAQVPIATGGAKPILRGLK